jgi:uncharacterized protein (DUF58 family)
VWVPIAAVGSANNFLFIVAIMLFGLALVSHWLAKRNVKSVRLSRRFSEEIFAGSSFTIQYLLRSDLKPWGSSALEFIEAPPLDGTSATIPFRHVAHGKVSVETGVFSIPTRGDKQISSGTLVSSFPFGLARYSVKCGDDGSLLVFPQIHSVDDEIPFGLGESRKGLERQDPSGTIPYHFREYASGDPYKHIDWKQTSKTGALITKLFSEEGSREVVIRLPQQASEEAISKAASLVVHFGSLGVPVALQGPGVSVAAGTGKEFISELLTILARWDSRSDAVSPADHSTRTVIRIDPAGNLSWKPIGEVSGPEPKYIEYG